VLFFTTGIFVVGFEFNKVRKFVLTFNEPMAIGAFGCCFDKRSNYIYKTLNKCEGYSIRKLNWKKIVSTHPEIGDKFNMKTESNYKRIIRTKMEMFKQVEMERLK
jgi:hypothetical protein